MPAIHGDAEVLPLAALRAPSSMITTAVPFHFNSHRPFQYKVSEDVVNTLRDVLNARGFVELRKNQNHNNDDRSDTRPWHFQWVTLRAQLVHEYSGPPDRKVNHYPGSQRICKKNFLAASLTQHALSFPRIYNFHPRSFILPLQRRELTHLLTTTSGEGIYITKPSSGRQGKGIAIISGDQLLSQLVQMRHTVVQDYIRDPFLIGGYKFDMRIYVLVTSVAPMKIYLFREGLARFSSVKYENCDFSNSYKHLTNFSVNKRNKQELRKEKDIIGTGCKWTLKMLHQHVPAWPIIWERVRILVVATVISIAENLPNTPRGFELFGFDVMLDKNCKPWLLEVNASPALATTTKHDQYVKFPMLNHMLDLIGLPESLTQRKNECQHCSIQSANQYLNSSASSLNEPCSMNVKQLVVGDAASSPNTAENSTDQYTPINEYELIFPFDESTEAVNISSPPGATPSIQEIKN